MLPEMCSVPCYILLEVATQPFPLEERMVANDRISSNVTFSAEDLYLGCPLTFSVDMGSDSLFRGILILQQTLSNQSPLM
jgi:hypothetical protein